MEELEVLRQQIDDIDRKFLALLKQRMAFVKKIGFWKKQNNIVPLDKKRWQEVLRSKMLIGRRLGLNKPFIKKIYELIHQEALKIEKKL